MNWVGGRRARLRKALRSRGLPAHGAPSQRREQARQQGGGSGFSKDIEMLLFLNKHKSKASPGNTRGHPRGQSRHLDAQRFRESATAHGSRGKIAFFDLSDDEDGSVRAPAGQPFQDAATLFSSSTSKSSSSQSAFQPQPFHPGHLETHRARLPRPAHTGSSARDARRHPSLHVAGIQLHHQNQHYRYQAQPSSHLLMSTLTDAPSNLSPLREQPPPPALSLSHSGHCGSSHTQTPSELLHPATPPSPRTLHVAPQLSSTPRTPTAPPPVALHSHHLPMAHQASTNQHRRHHDVTIPTTPQQPTSTKGVPALPMMPPAPRAGQSTTAPTTQAQPFRDYDKVCTANDKSPRGTPAIIGFLGDPTLPHMQLPPLLSVEVASCGADRDAHDNTNHTTTTTTSSSSNNSNNNNNNSNNNNDDDNSDRAPVMMLKTVERPPRPRRAPSTAMATTNGTPSHHSTTPSSDDFGNSGTSNPTCSSCDRPTPSSSDTDVERRHTQTSATNVDACDRCVAAEHELARLRSEVQYLTTLWACQSCDTTPRRSHRRHRHQR